MSQSLSTFYRDSSLPVYLLIHILLITAMNFLKTMYDFSRSICLVMDINTSVVGTTTTSFDICLVSLFCFFICTVAAKIHLLNSCLLWNIFGWSIGITIIGIGMVIALSKLMKPSRY